MARQYLIHRHSFVKNRAASGDTITWGEIAVNCHSESPKLYIKTATASSATSISIESFSPDSVLDKRYIKIGNETHYQAKNVVGASSGATANASATDGNVWLNLIENGKVRSHHLIDGSGSTKVTATSDGNICVYTPTSLTPTSHSHGTIKLEGDVSGEAQLNNSGATITNIVVNDDSHYHTPVSISGGTNGQILKTTGSGSTWVNQSSLSVGTATTATKLSSGEVGNSETPVYFSSEGKPVACTPYEDATVKNSYSATVASKLNNTTLIGSSQQPVYFTSAGTPTAISYKIAKSVPSGAVFTDQYLKTSSASDNTVYYLIGTTQSGTTTGTGATDIAAYVKNGEVYSKGTKVSIEGHGHSYAPLSHISVNADTNVLGHVKLKSDDLSTIEKYEIGEAAASFHNHNTIYLPKSQELKIELKGDVTGSATADLSAGTLTMTGTTVGNNSHTHTSANISDSVSGITSTNTASTKVTQERAVISYVENQINSKFAANNAMQYKGVINANKENELPKTFQAGWTYKVATGGSKYGVALEIGDMVIAVNDVTASTTTTSANFGENWNAIQVNTDGHVSGPVSSTDNCVVLWDGTTGKLVKNSSYTISKSVPSGAVFTDSSTTKAGHYNITETATTDVTIALSSQSPSHGNKFQIPSFRFDDNGHYVTSGTTDVVLPKASEDTLQWGTTNINGSISPVDAALSNLHSANRLAFGHASGVTIEYSQNAGSSWTTYVATDAEKKNLYSGIGQAFSIGGRNSTANTVNDQLRVTLNASNMGVYTRPRKLLLNISTNYAKGSKVKVETAPKGSATTFTTKGTYDISGWSGWNTIPANYGTFGGGATQNTNIGVIRLTFTITGVTSGQANGLTLIDIALHGETYWAAPSNMSKTGHLYNYDASQNAIFPARVSASTFVNHSGTEVSYSGHKHSASDITSGTLSIARLQSATTGQYGITQLEDSVTSTSTTLAATANAVKTVHDLVNGKAPKSHATSTTTYGVATENNYGHVKISNGDVSTVASADGVAAGMDHTHGNYSTTSHTHNVSAITGGTLSSDRLPSIPISKLPTGTDNNTVALGGHSHDKYFSDVLVACGSTTTVTGNSSTNGACYVQFLNGDTLKGSVRVMGKGGVKTYASGGTVTVSGVSYGAAKHNAFGLIKANKYYTSEATLTTTAASATTAPTIQELSTATTRYYGIETDKNGFAFVNVPWQVNTDSATTQTGHYLPKTSAETVSVGNQSPSHGGSFNIPVINFDNKGHYVSSGVTTVQLPGDSDSHYTTHMYLGGSGATSDATSDITNPFITLYDNTIKREDIQFSGTSNVTVKGKNGIVTISGPDLSGFQPKGNYLTSQNTSKNVVGASSGATANASATDGNVWLNHLEGNSITSRHNIKTKFTVTGNALTDAWLITSDSLGDITEHFDISAAIAQLSEGTSPAWHDDYIVAQYATGGTNITTYYRRKLSSVFKALRKSDITTALGYTPPTGDTHYETHMYVGASGATSDATADTTNPFITLYDNTTKREDIRFSGTSNVTVTAKNGVITISGPSLGGYSTTSHTHDASAITAGTVAIARLQSATTGQYGITQLEDSVTSTSTTLAATANAVKTAYNKATGATSTAASALKLAQNVDDNLSDYKDTVTSALNGKAPNNHATSATTYGLATTSNYGHVKLATGDMTATTVTNGVVASNVHNHDTRYVTKTIYEAGVANLSSSISTLQTNLQNNFTVYNSNRLAGYTLSEIFDQFDGKSFRPSKNNNVKANMIGYYNNSAVYSDIYMSGNTIHGATGFYADSDERLKTFHNEIEVDLDKIVELPKVYFTYNADETQKMEIGTSAQKVKELYPEIVFEDENGKLSVDYSKLSVIALKAIDMLNEERKEMKKDIEAIKTKLGL
jgi:hypothetical protein